MTLARVDARPPRPLSPAVPATAAAPSVRFLGPQWYATVMGTAIVASAGAALPLRIPGLTAVWALSALLLAVLLAARATHWIRHSDRARAQLLDPAAAPFHGCMAMALLAVGGAALATGVPGGPVIDGVLWCVGTVAALVTAAGVPYLMIIRHRIAPGDASPVWLLPVVAPMVSAALGPALAPYLPAGQARLTLLLGCYALFGLSLFGALLILPVVFARLVHHGLPLTLTPTVFLVLGPLGQSTTAVGALADAAPASFAAAAVLYGVPVLGFALLWLTLSAALVVRALRHGMRFSLGWWAFTFPVGTCATGAASLARHTGLVALDWLAVGLYALLLAGWATALVGTARGLLSGVLLAGPAAAPAAPR